MALVEIGITAMQQLVTAMEGAKTDITSSASTIRGYLANVMLSEPRLSTITWGSPIDAWMGDHIRDLNRRLAMARMIQASSPGIDNVTIDDSKLSTLTDEQVKQQVEQLKKLMEGDLEPKDIDPEVLKILADNMLDPYFAKALAEAVSPETLSRYIQSVNMQLNAPGTKDEKVAEKKLYVDLLNSLGLTLGLASQGTGSLAVPGMTQQYTDFIKKAGPAKTGAVNALSVVIGRGIWSDEFLEGVYHAVRGVEGGAGASHWALGGGPFMINDPDSDIVGYRYANDAMKGIMRALQSNPTAVAALFTTGPSQNISAKGSDHPVNAELLALFQRAGTDEETYKTIAMTLQLAISAPPVADQPAFQLSLAQQIATIGTHFDELAKEAEEKKGPLWKQIAHGLLDVIGLFPVLGDVVDLINGTWYAADGDALNAGLSYGSAIPGLGMAVVAGKWVKVGVKAGGDVVDVAKAAETGLSLRVFAKDGTLLNKGIDLTDPSNFTPAAFLSPRELEIFSGKLEFVQRLIAGNRFNSFMNPRYTYSEISLVTGNKRPFRLDSWTPGQAIVSRKLTQLSQISPKTAMGYIDEFVKKYPAGTKVANTAKNQKLGIAGKELDGDMILQVPPQMGAVPDDILKYAWKNNIHIVDINGVDLTAKYFTP